MGGWLGGWVGDYLPPVNPSEFLVTTAIIRSKYQFPDREKEGLLYSEQSFQFKEKSAQAINASPFVADANKMQLFAPWIPLRYVTYTTLFHVKKNFGGYNEPNKENYVLGSRNCLP